MCPDRATAEDIMGENVKILDSIHEPDQYDIDDSMILPPLSPEEAAKVEIVRGPNVKFLPVPEPPQETLDAPISLKACDNVSTDDITPASAEFSSMRSNIPLMSQYCYHRYDPEFAARAKEMGQSIIIGGENYGQGSSREHAAINPMYLGVKAVIAKSIARIHKGNLVNHGVIPMLFEDGADYDRLEQTDELHIDNLREQIAARRVQITDKTKGCSFWVKLELTDKEIYELQISELTGDINRASNYEAEIFYCGTMPFDNAYDVLSKNLPLVANEKPSTSPQDKPMVSVTENTIYFLPNTDAEQAQIYFYLPMAKYDKKDDAIRDAFNQYFSGGFNGLVMTEIREKRSMAYSAGAYIGTPALPGNPTYLFGNIGTQNDKANDALDVFMGLVTDMPKNADRIDNIKSYIRQEMLTTHPSFRDKAENMRELQRIGYNADPAKENLPKVDALTFDDIVKFYEENIKGKPYCIGVMGNPKDIDLKKLEKYGKVVKLNERKLFNTKDALF